MTVQSCQYKNLITIMYIHSHTCTGIYNASKTVEECVCVEIHCEEGGQAISAAC